MHLNTVARRSHDDRFTSCNNYKLLVRFLGRLEPKKCKASCRTTCFMLVDGNVTAIVLTNVLFRNSVYDSWLCIRYSRTRYSQVTRVFQCEDSVRFVTEVKVFC